MSFNGENLKRPTMSFNSGEHIPSRLSRDGASEQNTKKVLEGIACLAVRQGFLAGCAAGSFKSGKRLFCARVSGISQFDNIKVPDPSGILTHVTTACFFFRSFRLVVLSVLILAVSGISALSQRSTPQTKPAGQTLPEAKIKKALFYIENSESMFGYVNSITDYVEVVSELAEMPEFVKDKVPRNFYFINGSAPVLTFIGDNPAVLRTKLNPAGFHCGDITNSNLNGMFQTALKNAASDVITILISDGIYDIGGTGVTSLVTEGKATRTQFINRLMTGDLQTIIIKLNSQFSGDYFYSSKKGKIMINNRRPYYIWIFGESRLLGRYFPNEYISNKLRGYENMARFIKPGTTKVRYQATADNSTGNFKFDRTIPNRLNNAKGDSHGLGFQFSVAVDYAGLPFPEQFLTAPENYTLSNNYTIVSIKKPSARIYSVPFTPTHLVTVKTMKNPAGQLVISLINNVPGWISTTHAETEDQILRDKTHTYGFKYLTDGIIQAYESVSGEKSIASFIIDIH